MSELVGEDARRKLCWPRKLYVSRVKLMDRFCRIFIFVRSCLSKYGPGTTFLNSASSGRRVVVSRGVLSNKLHQLFASVELVQKLYFTM